MLKCLIDISVPKDSKCSKCCFYCDEKDTCECRCVGLEEWKTEEEIAREYNIKMCFGDNYIAVEDGVFYF